MRTRPEDRLSGLVDAAARVFALKGFRRAQMADIASELGVSQGLLYRYVESKEALFYLVIDRGSDASPPEEPAKLPILTPEAGAIARRVAERLRKEAAMPALSKALERPQASDASAELESVVRALYAILYRSAQLITILDRSAPDLPELVALFYGRVRGGLVARLARLIEMRAEAGQYRSVPHPGVAARLMVETITWFACHRRGDPASQDIGDKSAEETTVDFIVHSLVAESTRARLKKPKPPSKQH
ncbi:MAG: helix-turn-helix domain-containing protein [Rhodomicrobium sp.]